MNYGTIERTAAAVSTHTHTPFGWGGRPRVGPFFGPFPLLGPVARGVASSRGSVVALSRSFFGSIFRGPGVVLMVFDAFVAAGAVASPHHHWRQVPTSALHQHCLHRVRMGGHVAASP